MSAAPAPTALELALIIAGCTLTAVAAVICFAWQEAPDASRRPLSEYSALQWVNMLYSEGLLVAAITFLALPQGKAALAALPADRTLRAAIIPVVVVLCWVRRHVMRLIVRSLYCSSGPI